MSEGDGKAQGRGMTMQGGWSYIGIVCKAGEKGLKVISRGDNAREGMLRRRVGGWLGRALEKEIFVLKKCLGKVLNFGSKNLRTLG